MSSIHEDAASLIDSYNNLYGPKYWPEDLHQQAFDQALEFGRIALSVQRAEASTFTGDPAKIEVMNNLGGESQRVADVLINKIPRLELLKLERERRRKTIRPAEPKRSSDNPWGMTKKELAIFKRLPLGESIEEIAQALIVAPQTIKFHLGHVFRKAGVENRIQAAALAYSTYRDELLPTINADVNSLEQLTKSEKKVLSSIAEGLAYQEIAQQFSVQPATVRFHASSIYTKLDMNRIQLAVLAKEAALTNALKIDDAPARPPKKSKKRAQKSNGRPKKRRQPPEELGEERRIVAKSELKLAENRFRTSAEKAFTSIVKLLPEYHEPTRGQTFTIKDKSGLLADLLARGIIDQEQYETGQIDRAALAALLVIKAGEDQGFLSADQVPRGMEIIRHEEVRYFARLEGTESRITPQKNRAPQKL